MYELEQLEMEGMGETDGFDFEAVGELEDGEQEDQFLGDIIGGLFEDESLEAYEADPFLGNLLKKASSAASAALRGPAGSALKGLAKQAAQVAGGAIAGPTGANIASQIANQVFRESEYESEWEAEYEDESGGLDHEAFDEMNYHAAMAAEAETEEEADQFLGALLPVISQVAGPLIGQLVGDGEQEDQFLGDIIGGLFEEESGESWEAEGDQFLPALLPLAMPLIKKGIGAVGKMLAKNKRTRPIVRALPKIAAKALKATASQARRGQRPTPKRVAATVARETAKTLSTRPRVTAAIRQNRSAASRAQMRPRPSARPGARPGYRPTRTAGTNGSRRAYPTSTGGGVPGVRGYTVTGGAPGGYSVRRHGPIIGYVRFPVYGTRRPH